MTNPDDTPRATAFGTGKRMVATAYAAVMGIGGAATIALPGRGGALLGVPMLVLAGMALFAAVRGGWRPWYRMFDLGPAARSRTGRDGA